MKADVIAIALGLGTLGLSVVAPPGPCYATIHDTACFFVDGGVPGCMDQILQDGDCEYTENAQSGKKLSENYSVDCVYQIRYLNEDDECVNAGPPITYVRSCSRGTGESCGLQGGGSGGTP